MARNKVRTEVVPEETRELLKRTFGTTSTAFENLELNGRMTIWIFQRVWQGKSVVPGTTRDLETALDAWLGRMVERRRLRATA